MVSRVSVTDTESLASGGAPSEKEQQDHLRVVTMPISSLVPSDSPRLAGENMEHARVLAESEVTFPPIVVNRSTMRVIDGMHRLQAAVLRGQHDIEVRFFDGNEGDAFVFAVEANITHGLPLSLADRTTAAARIIRSHPQWSDRAIASVAGLAAKTVGAIRRRSTGNGPQSNARVGRDGRVRPLSTAEGRTLAGELMKAKPDASLREIASAAGISLGTAQDVRERLRRGENPVLPEKPESASENNPSSNDGPGPEANNRIKHATQKPIKNRAIILQNLRRDPSLRFADVGRVLLRLLHALTIEEREWQRLINNLPAHCTPMVSAAARACADTWLEFAEQLKGAESPVGSDQPGSLARGERPGAARSSI